MDKTDQLLIAALRRDGRTPIASLANQLKISRATARARLERLQSTGEITGFTVRLASDDHDHGIRGITLIKIAGNKTQRIIAQLHSISAIHSIHATNGKWDLIAEITTSDLAEFDAALSAMREIDGISESETNLILATRHYGGKSR